MSDDTDVNTEKLTLKFAKPSTYPPPGERREKRKEYMKVYMAARRAKAKRDARKSNPETK